MKLYSIFISSTEILFILFIVVMVFGADKIPDVAKGLGKGIRSLKNATNEIKNEVSRSVENNKIDTEISNNIKEDIKSVRDEIEDLTGSVREENSILLFNT